MKITLEDIDAIADRAHKGQSRRGSVGNSLPYIVHPRRVAAALTDETDKAVALLHDVLEDTDTTAEDLVAEGVPRVIVGYVSMLTKSPSESYGSYLEKIRKSPATIVKRVKIADIVDNLTDCPTTRQIDKYRRALMFLTGGLVHYE